MIMRVIICADGTACWRSAATRCDVFVDCRQQHGIAMSGITKPHNWGTWWAMDGSDCKDSLTSLNRGTAFHPPPLSMLDMECNALDDAAGLSRQVSAVQDHFLYNLPDGRPVRFECYLTGAHVMCF